MNDFIILRIKSIALVPRKSPYLVDLFEAKLFTTFVTFKCDVSSDICSFFTEKNKCVLIQTF